MERAVAYYRVSTKRQGKSGLGLDAQRVLVEDVAAANGYTLYKEFIEVDGGKKNDRRVLKLALRTCMADKTTLIIAKLDRISRRVAFISTLMESKAAFIVAEHPNANDFMLHIMAAVAELEGKSISERTKAALQVAKARGVELGYNGRHVLSKLNKIRADLFAKQMADHIEWIRSQNITTVRAIVEELNRRKIKTFQGANRKWHPASVHALLKRIERIEKEQAETIIKQ